MVQSYLSEAMAMHGLPTTFDQTITRWYLPLAQEIAHIYHQTAPKTLTVGVQGTQGSGKSTLADFLRLIFEREYHLQCAVLSIDDFYLTWQERQNLAKQVHPLFVTRGVPGTHDIALAHQTINTLRALPHGEIQSLVRFEKAIDDRAPIASWPIIQGPVNIIILEGWCVGLTAQPQSTLSTPVNTLEAIEDGDAGWRRHANQQLEQTYSPLFKELNKLIVLNAPSFECVYQWRLLQEEKLREKTPTEQQDKLLSPDQVKRFISHYQRLTEHALASLPTQADWTYFLNADHNIYKREKKEAP